LFKAVRVLLKTALIAISVWFLSLSWCTPAQAQDRVSFGGAQSFGFTTSYSPDSSHILIGEAEGRRTWTLGGEYTHRLGHSQRVRWDYEGSILPFYEELDPAVVAITYTVAGQTDTIAQIPPIRVTAIDHSPVGYVVEPHGVQAPIYAVYGNESTNGGAVAPLGARATLFQHHSIQPSFSVDLGFVVATRDIPVENSDQFNFMFSFGPGVQIFSTPQTSMRIEYIFRHISNAGIGNVNPGVDQGTFRFTIIRSR
jgi:lipid A 3-O-deacylase PagL